MNWYAACATFSGRESVSADAADRAIRSSYRSSPVADIATGGPHRVGEHVLSEAVALADVVEAPVVVTQELLVRENGDGLAHRVVVIDTQEDSRSMSVLGDLDPLMSGAGLVDQARELGPSVSDGKRCHVQNYSVNGELRVVETANEDGVIPNWYHSLMAFTVRTDKDLETALDSLSESEGLSRQEVVRRAVLERFERSEHAGRVADASSRMLDRWGDVLERLGSE